MGQVFQMHEGSVPGPTGRMLTFADLPSPDTKRWVPRRKAEVVAAVRGGLLSLDEACARYALSVEEFLSWQRNVERYGLQGLRATRQEIAKETRTRAHRDRNAPEHRTH
ncbi:MAG: CtrA inhibitor SciP [Rhizomicrobium sp.]